MSDPKSRYAKMPDKPEVREMGKGPGGEDIYADKRLFFQLQAYSNCTDIQPIIDALAEANVQAALYENVNDPHGIAIMSYSEDPEYFVSDLRTILNKEPFTNLTHEPEFTMIGRTYTIGYESDLQDVLIDKPKGRLLNDELKWVVYYPLRRIGAFNRLELPEQRKILGEHGTIGRAFGAHDLGQDIRLNCMGLDKNDNDFVIGLLGKELHPLSSLVQTMRKTVQTSQYIEKMGPFFVGLKRWSN